MAKSLEEMTREELLKILFVKNDVKERLSNLLVRQLHNGILTDTLHAHKVIEEIHNLELNKNSRTVEATQFKHLPLRGLWKKHFFQSSFIPKIISNVWKFGSKRSKKLDSLIKELRKITTDPEKLSKLIAQKVVPETFNNRESLGILTGEWVVYAKVNDINYYLTVATHDETDLEIRKRIDINCIEEFPFLLEVLSKPNSD